MARELSGRIENLTVSLLDNTGANPEDFAGSAPKLTVPSSSRAPGCSGGTDESWEPGACGGAAARKITLGRSSQKGFGALFLVFVSKPGNVQSLLRGINDNSLAFGCVLGSPWLMVFRRGHSGVN